MTKTNDFRSFSCRPRFIVAFSLILFCFSQTKLSAQTYGNVAMGGGGFVSGVITSKTQQNLIYCRTDVGGAYRWDAANSKWIQLLNWVSEDETSYLGVESLAIDPSNPNNLYMLVGTDYFNGGKTAILRSTDKGATFAITEVTSSFKAHGNGIGRNTGEKLMVDPNQGTILFCGSRNNGLFKSTNSGASWGRVTSLNVTTTSNGNGISFVVFDPSTGTSGNATQTLIVGISQTGTNLYRSNNGGSTFTAISGAPTSLMPQRAVIASDRDMYVTYANTAGPYDPSSGQIWKYSIPSGTWTNVTPSGYTNAFCGISVDPNNSERLVASTINTWSAQGGAWGDQMFITTNGGSSWTNVVARGHSLNPNGVTWMNSSQSIHWAGSIEFDPFNTKKVFVVSGNGLYSTNDIDATPCVWDFNVKGLEETVALDLVSVPGGPLLSGIGDYDGFRNTDPTVYGPQHQPTMGNNTGLAVAAANTSKVVRVGSSLYYSTNTGSSWTQATINGSGGFVSLSADGNTLLHSPASSSTTYRSTNNGSSWSTVSGLSFSDARTVADHVNSNKFYAYNTGTGAFLVSTNGGSSFSQAATIASGGSKHIRTVPGNEGHIWVALNNGGLTRSTNSGSTFSSLSNVTRCVGVGLGKAASGATYPTIYICGTVSGVRGIFRSTDQGASWTRINNDANEWGGLGNGNFIIGDMNVYGRVFMSTVGLGVVYIESGGTSCTPTSITPYIQVNGGTWTQTSSATVSSGATVVLGPQPTSGGSWSWSGLASGSTREVTITPTSSGTATATYTNASGCQSTQVFTITVTGGTTYVTIANRATGLLIDGMGRTSAGDHCGQYASSGSTNQQWTLETSGSYVYIKNRATGLYIDGRGVSTNGAYAGQWTSSTSNNLQWTQETAGSYVKFKNRATGLYLDGLGSTTNGADLSQWASSSSNNQQWTVTTTGGSFVSSRIASSQRTEININEADISLYPNPASKGRFTILLPANSENAVVRIYDNLGKMLYEKIAQGNNKIEIDSRLKAGSYIVRIKSKTFSFTKKLIVN
jgi:xyloglucan-specific exo-beta-1,4-glucanase